MYNYLSGMQHVSFFTSLVCLWHDHKYPPWSQTLQWLERKEMIGLATSYNSLVDLFKHLLLHYTLAEFDLVFVHQINAKVFIRSMLSSSWFPQKLRYTSFLYPKVIFFKFTNNFSLCNAKSTWFKLWRKKPASCFYCSSSLLARKYHTLALCLIVLNFWISQLNVLFF